MLSLFGYDKNHFIPYPFNGGTPDSPTFIQAISRKSIPTMPPYRFTAFPALCNEKRSCTTLTQQVRLFDFTFLKHKKSFLSEKDEKPVVPPLLAEISAHLTGIET
jgi:hypothetical protein